MNLSGKKFLVAGTGISGIAAAELLVKHHIPVVLYDENSQQKEEEIRGKSPVLQEIPILLGELPEHIPEEYDIAVLSPGIPTDAPFVERMRAKGMEIWGEIELACAFERGRILAITGTNGKTTTTSLLGEILKHAGLDVKVVGNIGVPYTGLAADTREESVTVAEISSFQLETVEAFRPDVSAILNVTPDHLNRHHTMENYAAAKEAVAAGQSKDQVCVLNYENSYTREFGERCPARVVWFSSARKLRDGFYQEGEEIYQASDGESVPVMNIHDMNLVGTCNVENVMAAMAITQAMGVPMDTILEVVKRFKAVEHRIEFVATRNGVDYYNDSKGTNPDAAIQGIRAMCKPTVLIGGGYDKQSVYDEWIEAFEDKVKCLVLIGQTREKIAACARAHGISNIVLADSFEEAFAVCVREAVRGDAVLLSPACASWGMFPNYEVRGRLFKELVDRLEESE